MTAGLSTTLANSSLSTIVGSAAFVKLHTGDPGSAGTSNASGTTTTAMSFKSFAYYAGDGAGASSLDEIKMGDTYAAVTR